MIRRPLFFTLLGISFCLQTVLAQVRIFNVSPSVLPGQSLSVQGNFSATAKMYLQKGTATSSVSLPVLVQSANQATAQIPAQTGLDLYQLWVEDQGQKSPAVFVNRALGQHFDSPEVSAGGSVRIFGRNLLLAGGTPRVRLIAQGSTTAHEAVIDVGKSDAYKLFLKLPTTLQTGVTYQVFVTNGLGGTAGETRMEQTLAAIAPGDDYFQLGVGWAAKLNFFRNVYNVKTDSRLKIKAVGDGKANDQPAIQAAIDRAEADGGGIVYLPAGTYKLLYHYFEYLRMKNRVVIQGAGKDQTIIKFGYEPQVSHLGLYWPEGVRQAGLADLSLLNIDETGSGQLNSSRGQGTEIFLQRVRFDLNRSDWLWLAGSDKLVIANTELSQGVDSRFNYRGPIQLLGCSNFVLRNNTFHYAVDGLNLDMTHEGVFENNRVYRDGSARYPTNTIHHVLIVNFARNLAVVGNEFKVINGPAQNSNDGETIVSEGGAGDRIDEETGVVSGASATTLEDRSKNWGGFRRQPVVAIVSGKGMGQWRTIVSRSGTTLQLDRPWEVVPGVGSHYAIFNWGAENWLIQNNRMEGNRRGITMYHTASHQILIVGNTLVNSGSIDLTPIQQQHNGRQQFIPMYNTQVLNNSVSNTDGSNGVFIGVHTVQHVQEKTFGTSVLGLEVRGNTVVAGIPNIPAVVDADFPEGYLNYLEYHQAKFYQDEQIPAILGSIFEDNRAVNCANGLYLNTGSYNTLVCNLKLENTGNAIRDDRLERVNRASTATASCAIKPVPEPNQPPVPPTPIVLIAPHTAQVGTPFSATLAAFTDPEGGTLTYKLSALPAGLNATSENRSSNATESTGQLITGTPTTAGTFVVTYSATDEQKASTSISFTLVVSPATPAPTVVTGNFEGFLDKLECGSIRGWVWDRNKPNTPFTVEFYLENGSPSNTTVIGRSEANIYRKDLKDANKGNGAHAYDFAAPASLKNGALVRARVLGSTYILKGSPKAYQCAKARASAESSQNLDVTLLGNPMTGDELEVEVTGAANQMLKFQVMDVQGRTVLEQTVEQTDEVVRQRLPLGGQRAGLLWLRVNSASQFKTVKVVKMD